MPKSQKGNSILAVVLLVLAVGAFGFYLYTKGQLNVNPLTKDSTNGYVLSPVSTGSSNQSTPPAATTSDKITLSVTSPISGTILKSGNVTVIGKTVPYADVFVNDQSTKADAQGNFSIKLTLDEGSNNLLVTANDAEGNVAEQNLSVDIQTF